jgi:transposase
MWTEEQRRIYRREGDGYPSDLRDAEWARLEPLIPRASPGGRPRKTDMRAAMNAILYLLRTGCPWRHLPRDRFPQRSTIYNIFRKFQLEGGWEAIWAELHMASRERMGREASPSAAVLDSQSIKSAEKTTKWVTTQAIRCPQAPRQGVVNSRFDLGSVNIERGSHRRASGRSRFGEETFAEARGNGRVAPRH